jgi:hypothetical protein
MKRFVLAGIIAFLACNEPNRSSNSSTDADAADSMPIVKPPVHDTSGVMTTPPINDSNVVRPDTSVKSK